MSNIDVFVFILTKLINTRILYMTAYLDLFQLRSCLDRELEVLLMLY